MTIIEEVRKEREDLARVLKKHTGIRKIVEDLYPDSAHFIFELLQNAEDQNATEVNFVLSSDALRFEHNGAPFGSQDIYAITDIGEGTKAGVDEKIGRFGVGFKSVFAYSEAPHIWSPTFAFKITDLVLPWELPLEPKLNGRTRFEFPFNNPKKSPRIAYKEIEAGLNEMAETTLLFLRSIASIMWQIGGSRSGKVSRIEHSDHHVEMLKQIDGETATSAHFIKFDRPVVGLESQRIAVAFALDYLPNIQAYSNEHPIAKQLKITPVQGQVAVFFPATKETSGLRFHLHAPFVPELSRASIKETPANIPLFEQLASLVSASLHAVRSLGLLTIDFLGVLPNPQDQLGQRYVRIRDSVLAAMNDEPLTPTYAKGHAPARTLVQAKSSIKDLLEPEDLEFLIEYDREPPQWAASASQRNSNSDRFLASLAIKAWGIEEFILFLADNLADGSRYISRPPYMISGPNEAAATWLAEKSTAWHQSLYALLYSELSSTTKIHLLKNSRLVRLARGSYSSGEKCFFPDENGQDDDLLPRVDVAVFTSGKSLTLQQDSRKFLEAIGVRAVGEVEQVNAILKQRYCRDSSHPENKSHLKDLRRFIALVEKEPTQAALFLNYFIFEAEHGKWCQPTQIYLDSPFLETGLHAFFRAQGASAARAPLALRYAECGISLKRIAAFAKAIGAATTLTISKTITGNHPQRSELRADWFRSGVRWTSTAIDEDWTIEGLEDVLESKNRILSLLIWKTMCGAPNEVLVARFRPNQQYSLRVADSSLVLNLRQSAWIPQTDGNFVKPSQASRDLLPDGFSFDPGYAWIRAVKWNEEVEIRTDLERKKEALAKELGFVDAATAERARRFADLPESVQNQILSEIENRNKGALPDRPIANPERRAQSVRAQAMQAPDKQSEIRERSVSIGREQVKDEADQYLRERYRNPDGEVTCQICKGPLPFKLDDGREFFEVVEFLPELRKRHPQNYLALCPNHSAMFRLVNNSQDSLREAFHALTGNELPVLLAEQELTIYFSKIHIIDLKAVLDAEDDLSLSS